MAEAAITIGNGNQNNEGYRGVILGNLNGIAAGTNYNVIIGNNHRVDSGSYNTIIGGANNNISGGTSGSTLIGLNNYSPTRNDAAFAMAYVMTNYASYDFADDAAAATGGVVLGQMYHTSGAMKIRVA
jgi:hypothetical protein